MCTNIGIWYHQNCFTSYILIHLSVCASVCQGLETQIIFKTVPPNSRAQKLFKTSITHFYFFTYRVPSPESQPIQVPSPNTQASNYLLGCLWSKSRMVKKNLAWAGRRLAIDHVVNKKIKWNKVVTKKKKKKKNIYIFKRGKTRKKNRKTL
jgi:hypothetical protein